MITMMAKTATGILITQHDESDVTDLCFKCGGLLYPPPGTLDVLKVDKWTCGGCNGTGFPEAGT